MTPEELGAEVRAAFAYAARYVSLLAANNPTGSSASVLARPDVDAVLSDALSRARETATDAIRQEWAQAGGPQAQYLTWLLDDVDRSYDALGLLRNAIRRAWSEVVPGPSEPGTNSTTAAGRARADVIRQAILELGDSIALRNELSLVVAQAAARSMAEIERGHDLERAGSTAYKQWKCRTKPGTDIPDDRVCHWCRALHNMVVPIRSNFPAGEPTDLNGRGNMTRPPRTYHGVLPGPPRHPRCRCHLVIVTELTGRAVSSESSGGQEGTATVRSPQAGGGVVGGTPQAPEGFLAAADIREMPEDRYQSLLAFLKAAVHELAQVLGRIRKVLRRG